MSSAMRWTQEQLDAFQAKRSARLAREDFVDLGIGTMRMEVVDTDQAAAPVAESGNASASRSPRGANQPVAAAPIQTTFLELRRLVFVLPMPPSVNSLYGVNRDTGQKYLLAEQRQFRSSVISIVRAAMRAPEGRVPALEGRVELVVGFYQVNRQRQDISNRLKALEDALTHAGAYHDDSQIDRITAERRYGSSAECVVELREIAA